MIVTIKDLEQLRLLQREVKLLTKKLDKLKERSDSIVTDSVRGSALQSPYQQRITTIAGLGGKHRIARSKIECTLKARLEDIESTTEAIEDFIVKIPHSDIRQIIDYRYLQGLTWEEVAYSVYPDKDVGENAPRKALVRFMEKNQKLSDVSVLDVV